MSGYDEMPVADALAELRAAGYEHAQIWRGNGLTTIYLNDGPRNARGQRTGGSLWSSQHRDGVRCADVWAAIYRLVTGANRPGVVIAPYTAVRS